MALIRTGDVLTALVAPTGQLPCVLAKHDGAWWIFSCIADALALGLPRPALSLDYLRERILGRPTASIGPLDGITRLLRSEAVSLDLRSDRLARRICWQPSTFAESAEPLEDREQAATTSASAERTGSRSAACNCAATPTRGTAWPLQRSKDGDARQSRD